MSRFMTDTPAAGIDAAQQEGDRPEAGPTVAARSVEYEAATVQWIYATVDTLMRARDPLYARIGREQVESVPRSRLELPDGGQMAVEPYRIEATGTVQVLPAIEGSFEDLHSVLSDLADQRLRQTMQALFTNMILTSEQVGTSVDAHGDPAEGLLTLLERMDIAFDDDGRPDLTLMVAPADAERVRAQLDAFTPEQQQRMRAILERKKEAFRAARRRRRLSRHDH